MSRKPRKPRKTSPNPFRGRSSPEPEPEPRQQHPSTPHRHFPLNSILRALSTPLRPPSHHPFLRAFSTPSFRRSEYSPLVRRLCQQGAYKRLPFDNELFIKKKLACSRCGKTGTTTQNLVFKQGHAGEWVRACNNPDCELIYYPAQPGTPPDLLLRIEAARETTATSSTVVTPQSNTSFSSSSSSSPLTHSQGRNVTPLGGQLEDWLSPLFQDLDVEPASRTSITPEPVAGPSTGLQFSGIRAPSPRCARDEEVARFLQSAIDEEDASVLQQFEDEPPSETRGRGRPEATTLSSLTAELDAISRRRPLQADASPVRAGPSTKNIGTPSRSSSPESSPSPRPRKKKRILVHPPSPPPIQRKYRGPNPPTQSVKPTTKAKRVTESAAAVARASTRSEKPARSRQKPSATDADPGTRPPSVIVISSGDESEPTASHRTARAPRIPSTRSAAKGHDFGSISITSSDSDNNGPPPATQPQSTRARVGSSGARVPRSAVREPSRDVATILRAVRDCEDSRAPSATHPRTAHARVGSPVARAPRLPVVSREPSATVTHSVLGSKDAKAPPVAQPRTLRTRGDSSVPRVGRSPPHRPSRDVAAVSGSALESENDRAPPATQPRTTPIGLESPTARAPRLTIRSRAPSRDVAATTPSPHDSEDDGAPPATQPRTVYSRALPVITQPAPPIVLVSDAEDEEDATPGNSSNKENDAGRDVVSCLDSSIDARLAARQALVRRRGPLLASLARSSSPSSSSSSSSTPGEDGPENQPPVEPHSNMGDRVDASEAFGHPFRFEVYPTVPELAKITNPKVPKRHWVLTVKIWYKNNVPPSTKMIPLEASSCCVRLSKFFIVARAFQFVGVTEYRLWNRFSTDWDSHSLHDYLAVSIADNHTLLLRLPTVATLASWPESISQAYGPCQTVDPRPLPSRKGKEIADN